MTEKFFSLQLRGLPGWMGLPLDHDIDAADWARTRLTASAAGLEPIESSIGLDAAIDMLERAVNRARALWDGDYAAPISMAFQPDPLGPLLGILDASGFPMENLPLSPERIIRLGTGGSSIVGPVETSDVVLPAGPATRYRATFGAISGEDENTFLAAGAVTYAITPAGLPGYVLFEGQWVHQLLGDAIAEQIDQMANRLDVEFVQ